MSGNSLCPGDHIPWRRSLDGSESRIQHMLMADDAQLQPVSTSLGTVSFVQVQPTCSLFLCIATCGLLELYKRSALFFAGCHGRHILVAYRVGLIDLFAPRNYL